MRKSNHRLAALFVSAAIVFTIGSARAEGEDVGGRVRGVLVSGGNWESFGNGKSYADLWGNAVYDVGAPRVVTYAFYANQTGRLRHEVWGADSLDNLATYNTAGSGWTMLYNVTSAATLGMLAPNWPARIAGTGEQAYRYYLVKINESPLDIHAEFYSKELLVSQETVDFWPKPTTETFNQADPAEGAKFTGHVDFVPGAGEATVTLYVAKTDHDDDLAAWQADSSLHTFAADGTYATGASFTIYAPNLPQGVWFGRVFATADGVTKASHHSGEFAVGTSAYYPPAYVRTTNCSKHYDANLTNGSDSGLNGAYFLVDEDPDVEIVAARVFHFNYYRTITAAFSEDAGATFDFGIPTPISTITTRTLFVPEKWPTTGWTSLGTIMSNLDCFYSTPTATPYDVSLHPSRWAKYVRFSGCRDFDDWDEMEFRTLPRPPEPIVHNMALGEPKGTSIGLTGYLAYRGNANKSPCSIYVSCVAPGAAANYQVLKTGWENATEWAGAVTGLSGETTYELNVIVSNELAGVQVITNASFTTPKFVPMPPSITFTGVTPDTEGNVTFSWNLTDTGTAGNDVDVYAKWGPDVGNLCEGVKIAEGVAIGLGSAKCEQVEAGADLVFVLYAVNNGGTDEGGTKTSAVTDSQAATTFGPSSFVSAKLTHEVGLLRAQGEIDVYGLGVSKIEIAYALVGSSETNTILVRACQDGDTKQFNFTTNLYAAVEGRIHCELRLTNSGRGKTWVSVADPKCLICGPDLQSHFTYTYVIHGDNNFSTYLDNYKGPYTLDLGNLRTVRGVWAAFHPNSGYTTKSTVWVSSDGVNYTPVMGYPLSYEIEGSYIDFAFTNAIANVRYVQLRGNGSTRMDVSEFHAIGAPTDLVVSADHVMAWGNKTYTNVPVNAPDDPQGVYFSGKFVSGGPAHVYACLSRKDHGADADAWLKSTCKDLGEFANGAKVEGYLPGAVPGQYFGKLVAVRTSDGAKAISPQIYRTNVGTKTFDGAMLMNATYVAGDKALYDGNNATGEDPARKGVFIFPVKDLHGLVPAGVRLWAYNSVDRVRGARIYISSNTTEIATTDYCETPKPIKTYVNGTENSVTWTQIADFGILDDIVFADNCWELPLLKPADKAKAAIFKNMTYIRIDNIDRNNCGDIELRLLRPAGMALHVK